MLPLVGHLDATVTAADQVIIHGDRYLDLAIEAGGKRSAIRVPMHAMPRLPEPGDRVRLKVLLGQVDSLEFLP